MRAWVTVGPSLSPVRNQRLSGCGCVLSRRKWGWKGVEDRLVERRSRLPEPSQHRPHPPGELGLNPWGPRACLRLPCGLPPVCFSGCSSWDLLPPVPRTQPVAVWWWHLCQPRAVRLWDTGLLGELESANKVLVLLLLFSLGKHQAGVLTRRVKSWGSSGFRTQEGSVGPGPEGY